MKIIFYGGRQAGAFSLLALAAARHEILRTIAEDETVETISKKLGISTSTPKNLNTEETASELGKLKPDLFVCVHGRKIVSERILNIPKHGGINVHPCLYKYPGADPITRMLADGTTKASVGVHRMTADVDCGEVLEEIFIDASDCKSPVEVYNKLYPLYALALLSAVEKITTQKGKQ